MGNEYIIIICVSIVIVLLALLLLRRTRGSKAVLSGDYSKDTRSDLVKSTADIQKLQMSIELLPILPEEDKAGLVELKDYQLLAVVDNYFSKSIQVVQETGTAQKLKKIADSTEPLYRAVIPHGAVLDQSRNMPNAVRGSFHGAKGFKGNANWVPVDQSVAKSMAVANVTNAAMNIGSMVVGQYYMSQIQNQLTSISSGIQRITGFQDNEYWSKVQALIADTQKTATFQMEIMQNNDKRNLELSHLRDEEHKCAELLGQANKTIIDACMSTELDYSEYEKATKATDVWCVWQQTLLRVLSNIADLTFALNMGAEPREQSFFILIPYMKQVEESRQRLGTWHEKMCKKHGIDVEEAKRKRAAFIVATVKAMPFLDDSLQYKAMPKNVAKMIKKQTTEATDLKAGPDLFQQDVQLIHKEGKWYYLPEEPSN